MKLIITESRLENTVINFLNKSDFFIFDNKNEYHNYIYFLNNKNDHMAMISVYHKNAYGYVKNWVFVNPSLIEYITKFIPIDEHDFLKILSRWVGEKLNINVERIEDTRFGMNGHRLYLG